MQSELPDTVDENVEAFVDYTDADITTDEFRDRLVQQYEETADRLPDDQRWRSAIKRAKKEVFTETNTSSGNDSPSGFSSSSSSEARGDMASIITLGFDGIMQWVHKDHDDYESGMDKDEAPKRDVLIANGIVRNEETGRTDIGVVTLDSSRGIDLDYAMDLFGTPLTVVSGRFSFGTPDNASDGVMLYTTYDTEIEEVDDPMPPEERQELVQRYVDDVDIASLVKNPEEHLSLSNSNGWPADFGIDIKRIPAAMVWGYSVMEDDERGVYNILDDSVMGPGEVEGTALHSEKQHVASLAAWGHSRHIVFDENSECDFYGALREDYNGQIQMQLRGVDPIEATRIDGGKDFGSHFAESF